MKDEMLTWSLISGKLAPNQVLVVHLTSNHQWHCWQRHCQNNMDATVITVHIISFCAGHSPVPVYSFPVMCWRGCLICPNAAHSNHENEHYTCCHQSSNRTRRTALCRSCLTSSHLQWSIIHEVFAGCWMVILRCYLLYTDDCLFFSLRAAYKWTQAERKAI